MMDISNTKDKGTKFPTKKDLNKFFCAICAKSSIYNYILYYSKREVLCIIFITINYQQKGEVYFGYFVV